MERWLVLAPKTTKDRVRDHQSVKDFCLIVSIQSYLTAAVMSIVHYAFVVCRILIRSQSHSSTATCTPTSTSNLEIVSQSQAVRLRQGTHRSQKPRHSRTCILVAGSKTVDSVPWGVFYSWWEIQLRRSACGTARIRAIHNPILISLGAVRLQSFQMSG
jgi:hypothetical protein